MSGRHADRFAYARRSHSVVELLHVVRGEQPADEELEERISRYDVWAIVLDEVLGYLMHDSSADELLARRIGCELPEWAVALLALIREWIVTGSEDALRTLLAWCSLLVPDERPEADETPLPRLSVRVLPLAAHAPPAVLLNAPELSAAAA
jgi:hypothetical protein